MRSVAVALRSEMLLGALLSTRHRSVWLALVLALAVVAVGGSAADALRPGLALNSALIAAGTIAAAAGARLLAPGAGLWAARRTGSEWWAAPTGRLGGVLLLLAPPVVLAAVAFGDPAAGWVAIAGRAFVVWAYGAAIAALAMGLGPSLGASGAGAVAVLAVWLGPIPPSGMHALLEGLPVLRRVVVMCWNSLPLAWRARRLFEAPTVEDAAVLCLWVLLGVVLAAWGALRTGPVPGRGGQPA